MLKVKNLHRNLKNEILKSHVETVINMTKGVVLYASYQPYLKELDDSINPFGLAITNCKLGGTDRTAAKNKIQDEIILTMDAFIRKIEDAANAKGISEEDGTALITGAGLTLVEKKMRNATSKKAITFLDVPTGFKVTDLKKQGAVEGAWNEDANAVTYLIMRADTDGKWELAGVSETSPVTLTGFASQANQTFKLISVGNGTVMSDGTASVTVYVS